MWPVAVVFCLGCVLALAVGRVIGQAIDERLSPGNSPAWLPGLILLPALLPLSWHYQHVLGLARGYLPTQTADFGYLELVVPIGVVALWLSFSALIRRIPLAALAFPILSTYLYVAFVLGRIVGPPRDMPLERNAFVILLAGEAAATCLIFGMAWGMLSLPGMLRRWPVAR
ncbi:hypothetical protein [Novosphingobium aquimarinum]|uniref:hypothetical protein n=1 Tax=Novosphingobium aquimarinum TaxID=2682494 RepID=UPI0012EB182F|nr:hypothetical protein [Novosphingobium aquimarinum]